MRGRWQTLIAVVLGCAASADATFTTFESGQVRPLAASPDGTRVFAVNTPDDYLEIFTVDANGDLTHDASVPVGLEPVAVAARTNGEVWVVNQLSDSVSIVDVASNPPRVVRTLLVGDEPRDVVFAGAGGHRAFITTAHRGQNRGADPELTTPGVGRADVWVFDVANLGTSLGGTPLRIKTLFCDTPRALAVSPDGSIVYAAAFHSGNGTTVVPEEIVCNGGASAPACGSGGSSFPGGLPAPNTNADGVPGPETGLIVRLSGGRFRDRLFRDWTDAVRFNLPDRDVFAITADNLNIAPTPIAGIGTVLFNMAVNPVDGTLYVSNTEARNENRFEGPGIFAGGQTVRGHLHEARITVVTDALATVTPRFLNKHIDYAVVPSPPGVKEKSLAIPTAMAVSSNGATLYLAAFGSSAIGVFSTSQLRSNTFTPSSLDHIPVSGGGPSGLVLDEARDRLYVLTRFDNAVTTIDLSTRTEVGHAPLHNPEPNEVVNGRMFLYDARLTSSNGEAACASCHVFGDFDSLAWDLGNPDAPTMPNPNPFVVGSPDDFHPMKGPLSTQSLRGLANHGPMHWRGDRTGGAGGGDPLDEHAAFEAFNVAFDSLLGRGGAIPIADMQAFADFILQVTYPPNPIRNLDDSLTPAQQAGRNTYFNVVSDVTNPCNGCHTLDPSQGFFGTSGNSSVDGRTQVFKVPHLRNAYQKVGMFGMAPTAFVGLGDNDHKGDQVRGFGFATNGETDTLFRFHGAFSLTSAQKANLEQFVLAFDSNLAPIVGQQVTLSNVTAGVAGPRITLLEQRADAGECELTAKGVLAGEQRGWLRLPGGLFASDRGGDPLATDAALRAQALASGQELTFHCVPPGSGVRVGIDRDEDGAHDRDELDAGSDPADAGSVPATPSTTTLSTTTLTTTTSTSTTTLPPLTIVPTHKLTMLDKTSPQDLRRRKITFLSKTAGSAAANRIVPPAPSSANDPRSAGAVLMVYNAHNLTDDAVAIFLPASKWTALGTGFQYRGDTTAAITRVIVRPDLLSFKGGRSLFGYSLNEPQQGSVAVRLAIGSLSWCAEATPKLSGDFTTVVNDHVDRFVGRRDWLPATCPPSP